MKPLKNRLIYVLTGFLATGTVQLARAEGKSNPYQGIPERNSFGLKPPPPPPDTTPVVPVIPPGKVVLTGITTMFGPTPRVLLEITETEAGKVGLVRKPIMREGDRDGAVEVVSIDVEKSLVKIRNAGTETNLTFETPKLTVSVAPTPGLPGGPLGHLGAGMPNVISPANAAANNSGRGSGVTMGGSTATPGGYGGLRSIPSRAVRTDGADAIDPARQYLNMHLQSVTASDKGIPHPPIPPMPGGPPSPGGQPSFGGPPRLPGQN